MCLPFSRLTLFKTEIGGSRADKLDKKPQSKVLATVPRDEWHRIRVANGAQGIPGDLPWYLALPQQAGTAGADRIFQENSWDYYGVFFVKNFFD